MVWPWTNSRIPSQTTSNRAHEGHGELVTPPVKNEGSVPVGVVVFIVERDGGTTSDASRNIQARFLALSRVPLEELAKAGIPGDRQLLPSIHAYQMQPMCTGKETRSVP